MKNNELKILNELEPILQDAFEDLASDLKKSNALKTQELDAVGIRKKYLKAMQGVFKKHFKQLYRDSEVMAATEVKRSELAKKKNENIAFSEFLDHLDKETYQYIGDYEYTVNKKVRNLINTAIKDGRPISDVVGILDDELEPLSSTSLERYSRTKSTEVFNKARMEYFNSSGVVAAYQFAAVLDDRTSEICGELHGLTFPADEAPIPPMHFNCRSVLVPIMKFEEWSEDGVTNSGQNVEKFLEREVSDKGFSVYIHKIKPKVGDPNVDVDTVCPDNITEVTTYSFEGKPFQVSTCVYKDDKKDDIAKLTHKRLD
jgi:SPP1 gp7 family putative phage head morphogenesis protein